MGELPSGWARARLGDLVIVNPRQFSTPTEDNDLISKVPMAAVEAESGRIDPSETISFGERKSLTPFEDGDVLFAKVTPCMENGKIALAENLHGGKAVGSTELFVLRPGGAVDARFLTHFLLQKSVRNAAEAAMTGAVGLRRVPRTFLEALEIPLPPLAEQRRIVEALEDHLSRLDAGIESLRIGIKRCDVMKANVLRSAVLGELTDSDSPGTDDYLAELASRRKVMTSKRRSKAAAPSGVPAMVLPETWAVRSVDELCWNIEYGTSAKASSEQEAGSIPVLRMGNIQDRDLDYTSLKYLDAGHSDVVKLTLEPGDLLFNRTNSAELVGKSAVFNGEPNSVTFASYLIRCRTVPGVEPGWLNLVINSSVGRSYLTSVMTQQVGQANINGSKLAAMPVPVPSQQMQQKIVAIANDYFSSCKRMRAAVGKALSRAENLRQALLATAFAGRLAHRDVTDEPAPVLLERIVSERSVQTNARKTARAKKATVKPPDRMLPPTMSDAPVQAGTQEGLF